MTTVPPNIPSPDPSRLTTEQLRHEIAAVKELLEIRLDAMDKAAVVLSMDLTRVPTLLDRQIAQIKELVNEKFTSVKDLVNEKFASVKELASAMQTASGTAITAAFAAADKVSVNQALSSTDSIRKSDMNFTERLKSQESLLNSTKETLGTQIGELKARLDRGEGAISGGSTVRTENRLDVGTVISFISLMLALGALLAVFLHGAPHP